MGPGEPEVGTNRQSLQFSKAWTMVGVQFTGYDPLTLVPDSAN